VWQALTEELADTNLTIVAVALESRGVDAALPYIEAANPTYPCLVDRQHVVAELFGMVNVPTAVWINEEGRIVRPAEPAGSNDAFRKMDPATGRLAPEDLQVLRSERQRYLDGIRDWARHGDKSPWALDEAVVRDRLARPSEEHELARAHFRLGEHLWELGHLNRAQAHFAEAVRLHPESWEYRRQALDLEQQGKSMGQEYWAAVTALGDRHYYPPIIAPEG
jgi:tetratricopeptide (TPR) repeat protein